MPPAQAGKLVKRLMAPDMWSGWGIRNELSHNSMDMAPHPNPGTEATAAAVLESDGRRLGKLCSWEIIEHSFRRPVGGVDSGCREADERWWVLEGDD